MELNGQLVADNIVVLSLEEDSLDASNARKFRKAVEVIIDQRPRIVLDLSSVNFMDSSGLGALVACQRMVNSRNGEFRLCTLNSSVRALFDLMRMHRVFNIHQSRDEALRSFS